MLKVEDIHELIKLIDQSSIDEFTYENEGTKVTMKKSDGLAVATPAVQAPAVQPAPQVQVETAAKTEASTQTNEPVENKNYDHEIVSPMVGTFYSASNPESPNFVNVGSQVSEDTVVCIVEAMKLFNEIEAEISGEIVEVLVENGELVEYGQPLFRVKTK